MYERQLSHGRLSEMLSEMLNDLDGVTAFEFR